MSVVMVVLGAGASYGAVRDADLSPGIVRSEWRPPLASELFENRLVTWGSADLDVHFEALAATFTALMADLELPNSRLA
jgi:hypothetical protein